MFIKIVLASVDLTKQNIRYISNGGRRGTSEAQSAKFLIDTAKLHDARQTPLFE